MTDEEFRAGLSAAKGKNDLTRLMSEVFETASEGGNTAERVNMLIDAGFDPRDTVEDASAAASVEYGYCESALSAARVWFGRLGLPDVLYADMPEDNDYAAHLRSKIDYNYYRSDYVVKLYLLVTSFLPEDAETYIRFHENLYEEMFDPEAGYTSPRSGSKPCRLSCRIFRDVERFDFMIEMTEQERGLAGCFRIHIFERNSRIGVAVYE